MDIQSLFSVKDKVVLVTGGSRGIGLMIAQGFVANGAKVYISSRKASVCDKVAQELNRRGPGQCISLPADLQDANDIKRLVAAIAEREPRGIHVLVNNAGANWGESIDQYSDDAFDKVLTLNVRRIFTLSQLSLPLLEKAATVQDPARIINIGSIDGIRVPALETYAYSASKAAVHHMSRVLAAQLGKRHITVNAIAPGPFPSKMMDATLEKFHDHIVSGVPLGRVGQPRDMAGVCVYLASPAGAYVTGALIAVDGGSAVSAKL
ncbi:hypothetical protein IWQ60_003255 [Tieghemiomyces parasiticus]|uniref:Ketoreductase domain-containing protein n=1 Tax=Tieghemiomyces parasiticus TaxID=78921 RepID=A0A9W8AB60_9FUNG|nr:hypothetical protein IWQ60_003255 [Tieghemiomyces parasiticus]